MTSKRVLIIEDDKEFAQLIDKGLSRGMPNLVTTIVADGVDGSQEVEFEAYDLIITDLQLPRKSGESILKRVKFSPVNSKTPVIVITGFASDEFVRSYAPLYLLQKPLRISEIVAIAMSLLALETENISIITTAFKRL